MPAPGPLDDVEFLAPSPHRVDVLGRLREGAWNRPDLHAATGIAQPTLGRVLGSLEARRWAERRGRDYALTALGERLEAAFADLLDAVETVQELGDVVPLLPTEEVDFDGRRLASAIVTTPEPGDGPRLARRGEALFDGASRLSILADSITPGSLRAQHGRVDGDPYAGLFPAVAFPSLDAVPVEAMRVLELGPQDPAFEAGARLVENGCARFGEAAGLRTAPRARAAPRPRRWRRRPSRRGRPSR